MMYLLFQKLPILLLLFNVALPGAAQTNVVLTSPDSLLVFSFQLTDQAPTYQVTYRGRALIGDSELGLTFQEGSFQENLEALKPQFSEVDETYDLVVGKTKTARDQHRQVIIPLVEKQGARRQVNLIVRVFNDGVAFRYAFPQQEFWSAYTLLDEISTFNIAGNPTVHTLFWDTYTSSHEGFYHILPYQQIKEDTLIDMPALLEFPGETFMAITEASLRDYAGMYLKKKDGVLTSQLSPLPGQTTIKVKATLPHHTPWRVMMIGNRIGALLESNILTSLNEPTAIQDVSWIKPGKTSFHWWNGDITPDTTFAPGINFETNKYYIGSLSIKGSFLR